MAQQNFYYNIYIYIYIDIFIYIYLYICVCVNIYTHICNLFCKVCSKKCILYNLEKISFE